MADAEDVLQDSWMRGFLYIGTFDGRSAFATWVTRIAINSALSMIKRTRRQGEFSLDDPNSGRLMEMHEVSRNPEECCLEAERLRLAQKAIWRSPLRLRAAIEIGQSQDGPVSELSILAGFPFQQ
jgi:DNA-directed RNA polymerase specialized sigma24 family protein